MTSRGPHKITVSEILRHKNETRKIVVITAYDHPTARIADSAGVDVILVGDSGGMVVLGYDDTRSVKMEEMLTMSAAVARGANNALLVGDMPFMSYQASIEDAVRNAGRFIQEGGMDAVKIEGGRDFAPTVKALTRVGIPVMAHIGFTPQTTPTIEGYRVQGKTAESAAILLEDASALEEAGAFSIVLEMVTLEAARLITESVSIPTIGIGAGHHCDGQVLVLHDLLGLFERPSPKFAKRYADLGLQVQQAIQAYRNDVLLGNFPSDEQAFHMEPAELEKLQVRRRSHPK